MRRRLCFFVMLYLEILGLNSWSFSGFLVSWLVVFFFTFQGIFLFSSLLVSLHLNMPLFFCDVLVWCFKISSNSRV